CSSPLFFPSKIAWASSLFFRTHSGIGSFRARSAISCHSVLSKKALAFALIMSSILIPSTKSTGRLIFCRPAPSLARHSLFLGPLHLPSPGQVVLPKWHSPGSKGRFFDLRWRQPY